MVTIGSPNIPMTTGYSNTTRIYDPVYPVTYIVCGMEGFRPDHEEAVHNGKYNPINAHLSYFDNAEKAANILDYFWRRI